MSVKPLFEMPSEIKPEKLEEALQQAINLEIATIPTYLYTYYSIKRSWSQDAMSNEDQIIVDQAGQATKLSTADGLRAYIKKHNRVGLSDEKVTEMALDIQVYANKSAALIMSVAIEEMLHTALSSNVKQAIFGPPQIMEGLKGLTFPAYLPGHEPYFRIDAAKFSQEQLKMFLKIESPEAFDSDQPEKGKNVVDYTTIGAFYNMLQNCVKDNFPGPYQNNRPQLLPGKGFYGPNSINTVYYDRDHNPRFPNEDDSGDLRHVYNGKSAIEAMEEVIEQGEGHQGGSHLTPDGEPICKDLRNPKNFDDPSNKELSHFAKFLQLYCQGDHSIKKFGVAGLDFHSFFVHNVPTNPRNQPADDGEEHVVYASNSDVVATSNLINAIYTYLFLMVESCYHNSGHTQYEVFMFGIHKSMIWALSELCNTVTSWVIHVDGEAFNVAPTFEPYDFTQSEKSPRDQILDLVKLAPGAGSDWDVSWTTGYVENFPDVSLNCTVSKNPLIPAAD